MKKLILLSVFACCAISSFAQLITPFTSRFSITQKGGIVILANTAAGCGSGTTACGGNSCAVAHAEVPPAGTAVDNDFVNTYVDVDGDATTFMSSSDSLNLASCTVISFAGLYWGAGGSVGEADGTHWATRNTVKLKVNNGTYTTLTADATYDNNTGYKSYHNFKDITSIVSAAGAKGRYTIANMPLLHDNGSTTNRWGGWAIVIVYKNDLENYRNLTVFNGLTNVSSANPVTDLTVSGFLTPPSGPVSLSLGVLTYDGDRGFAATGSCAATYKGDSLLFNGAGSYRPISDAVHPMNDVFNSSIANNGVLTPYRNPLYSNTLGHDASIFVPNNTAKIYIGNAATSATIRQKTGGETYLTQVVTSAIDVYEPDARGGLTVVDLNGGSVVPGDTLEYTGVIKNIGSNPAINTYIVDTLGNNVNYVPASMKIVAGPNAGNKTDAIADDQADYFAAARSLKIRIGTGANGVTGGTVVNSATGADSTVFKFRAIATSDCIVLLCHNTINNRFIIYATGQLSGNTFAHGSNPLIFDAQGCPVQGTTNTVVSASGCVPPTASSNSPVCATNNIVLSATNSPFANYSWAGPGGFTSTLQSPTITNATVAMSGTYTVTITLPGSACVFTATTTVVVNPKPTITSTSSATICSGGTVNITLTSSAASTYTWIATDNPNTTGESTTLQSTSNLNNTITDNTNTAQTVTYTVTPTGTAGGCAGTAQTVTVTVNPTPNAIATPASQGICMGTATSIALSSSVTGTTFSWSVSQSGTSGATAGSGATIAQTLNATGSTAGTATYTITPSANGCPGTPITVTVTVTPTPIATFSYIGNPFCQNGSNPSPTFSGGGVAGTFTSSAGLSINAATGTVNLAASTPGTYTVTNTIAAAGGCATVSATASITITALPVATFSYTASPYCKNGSNPSPVFSGGGVAGTFTAGAGLSINAATGLVNLASSTAGTYTVTNTIAAANGCPAVTATATITITALPVATFSYTASPYCQNGIDPSPTFSGGGVAGTFTAAAGLVINSSTGVVNLSSSTAGTYTVTNTIAAANGCPAVVATATITITPLPIATFNYPGTPYCRSGAATVVYIGGGVAGSFSSTAGLSINTVNGTVNLAASTAGTYTVTNTIGAANGCPAVTATTSITITALPVIAFSYTGSPYCQNGTNPSPTFTSGGPGASFTAPAGLNINPTTGFVNLSLSTPGTYTVTYTVPAAGGCPAVVATAGITITALPIATFDYPSTPYCQSGTNPAPNFIGGGVAGNFTSTAGLSINSGTGVINLAASTPGTYTVTNTIAAASGCPAVSASATVTITALPIATFNYVGSPYCQNASNPSPVFTGGGVAGTFTSTAGLVIDASTGTIDIAGSTAGTYTITNTIAAADGCPAVTATATITITAMQVPDFAYSSATYCHTGANPTPTITGTAGGTFAATPATLVINASTGLVNLIGSPLGTYTITYTTPGPCATSSSVTLTITTAPSAAFSYPASPFCQGNTDPFPTFGVGASGGTFTSSPAGLVFDNATTGQIDLTNSTPGTYTITNTIAASGGCAVATATTTITINTLANATFSYTGSPYCKNGSNPLPTFTGGTAGTFTSAPSGLSINSSTGLVNLAGSTAGTYTVYNTIAASGPCPVVIDSETITITALPVATFNYTGSPYCQTAANPLPTFTGGGVAGTFSSTPGLVIDPGTGFVNLGASTPGTYTVTNTIDANAGCPAVTATATVTITALPIGNFSYPGTPYCKTGADPSPVFGPGAVAGTFTSSPAGLVINSSTGLVTLATSNPGIYTITNTIAASGGCPAIIETASITITALPVATFGYTGSPYCANAANPTPVHSGGGIFGTFTSSPAGLVINASTGVINIASSTPGTYTVTNTVAATGGCPSVSASASVTIIAMQISDFSYSSPSYCQTGTNPTPTITGVAGGSFVSSPAGLIIDASTGTVNLSGSSLGTYTITYTTPGPCATSQSVNLTITPGPTATFSYIGNPFCQGNSNPSPAIAPGSVSGTYSSSPAGLVFLSSSTGQIDLTASTPGTYTITNTIAASGGCAVATATTTVTINPLPIAGFSYTGSPYCQSGSNPSPTFVAGGIAGTFTSTAGLVIDAATGLINLASSTPGTYTVTNTIAASSPCPSVSATATVTITPLPIATFNYTGTPYCQNGTNPSPTFTGGGVAGVFSSTSGLVIDNATGLVNLATSATGTYTVTNTIAAANGCPIVTATATITITPLPIATFSYTGSPYCKDGTNPLPTFSGGGVGGTFTSTAGLVINPITGLVDLTASTAGTYTVTNTIAAASGCPAVIATATITITPLPIATFSYPATPYCSNGTDPLPVITGVSGVFSSTSGLVIDPSTGLVSLAASTPGTYTVTNTIVGTGGCPTVTATATITITPLPIGTFSYTGSPYCQNSTNPLPTFTGGGVGGTFSSSLGLIINSSSGLVNLSGSTSGTYTVYNIIAAASGCPAVVDSATITITALLVATFNYPGGPFCQDTLNPFPAFTGGGIAGVFSAPSGVGINSVTGEINLSGSTAGTYTITNTVVAANGCPDVIATATVTINPRQDASFNYSSATFCKTGTNPLPTITGTPGGTFTSTPAGLVINPSTGLITLFTSTLTTYTITYTTPGPCPSTSSVILTITNAPSATFTYATPFCSGTAGTVLPTFPAGSSSGIFTSTPAGLVFVDSTTGEINLTASLVGTYTITNTIAPSGGCALATATSTIEIFPAAAITVDESAAICAGSSYTLSATINGSATSLTWTTTGTGTFDNTTSPTATYTPSPADITAGSVVLTATSDDPPGPCPPAVSTVTLVINGGAIANAGVDTAICSGSNYTLSGFIGGVASSLTWTTSGTGTFSFDTIPNPTYTPSAADIAAGSVTLTITTDDPFGPCPAMTDAMVLTIFPSVIMDTVPNIVVCNNATIPTIVFTSNLGTTSFNWTNDNPTIGIPGSGTGNISSFVAANSGTTPVTATITVTPIANICTGNTITFTITVNPTPVYTGSASAAICGGGTVTIPLTTSIPSTFTWIATDNPAVTGESTTLQTTVTIINTLINTTSTVQTVVYTVTPTAISGGCASVLPQTVTITVNPSPALTNSDSVTICSGVPVNLTLTSVATSTYSWVAADNVNTTGESTTAQTTATITDVLVNTTLVPQVVVYTVTSTATVGGCISSGQSVYVTVNPTSAATISNDSVSLCSGATLNIPLTSPLPATYTWVATNNVNTVGESTTIQTTSTINDNITNNVFTPQVVVYNVVVTTTAAGCTGSSQNIYVTVYPTPDVNLISQQTYCNGDNTTPVVFTGDVAGTTYNWTNSTTFIGLPASGTGDIPSFTASNITNVPIIATIIITPTANGCLGTLSAFSFLVNPTPTTNPDTSQVVCNGDATTHVVFTGGVLGTTFTWTNDTPSIGLAASGADSVPVFNAVNNGTVPVVATISVTPVANGCTGLTTTFTITVKPSPTVTAVINQIICTGAMSTPVVFTGPVAGSTFTWTNNNTSTGLGASGADSVPSFTGTNVTSVIQTSTITVMPVASGCPGVPYTFTISVYPVPVADTVPSQTVCTNSSTSTVTFTGPVAGSTFQWTNSLPSIGLAASGTGDITSFTAVNTGVAPDTALITVTPIANGCSGVPVTFNIIVNPAPSVNTITPVAVCNGSTTPSVTFTSTTAGTTFTWTNPNTSIGLGASGADSIPSFTAVNTGSSIIIDTITVTPSASGCPGVPNTFTITIYPTPAANSIANQTLCEGSSTTPVVFSSPTDSTTYTWTNNNPSIGLAASGTGNIGSFVTNDTSTASVTATITVTPVANGCTGTPSTFTITVNPIPVANAGPAMFMPCNGFAYLNGTGSSTGANITYNWTASPGNVVSGANNITALGNQLGIYTLTVTNTITGCSSSDTTSVFGTMPPVASFTTTPDPAVGFVPLDVTFTNTSINSNSYIWNWGDGITYSGFDTSHVFIHSGAYNVILIATNGPCYDTATVTVVVYDDYSIVIPNIFTPNDDGINDTWSILCKGVSQLHGEVFDRWGLKLYEWNTIQGGWDGYTTSGQHAAQGTYFYILKIKDIHDVDHIEQGSFMLVR